LEALPLNTFLDGDDVKTINLILAFFLLVSVSFCAVERAENDNPTLYQTQSAPGSGIYAEPYLQFREMLSGSTDARVLRGGPANNLGDNAIVCEGNMEFALTGSGIWARGGNLEAHANYWYTDCDPYRFSGSEPSNVPILMSDSDYRKFQRYPNCGPGESCYGSEGPLTSVNVDSYEGLVGERDMQRKCED
jgi:hypothetical protein